MRDRLAAERAIATVARRQHGLITLRQLCAIGFDRSAIARRVAAGRLHRVHRGVYAVGHLALTRSGHRLAAVLAVSDQALASHITAAAIWEIRTTSSPRIDVTTSGRQRSRGAIRVHERAIHADDRTIRDGIPVTSLARTLVDLGDVVPPNQVRNAFVRAEQHRLIDMTAIDACLKRSGRTRGARHLREVLRVYDPRWEQARSTLELEFLSLATAAGIPEPEVNAWINDRFLVDALWRSRRLIVEVDSRRFHDIPSARRNDARRDHTLRAIGYRVLRVTDEDLATRPEATGGRIHSELQAGAA